MTHICVSKLTIIGSDYGLSPERRQAIIWTSAGISLIGTLGTRFSEILSEIYTLSFTKMRLKMSSAKWRPLCLGLNVLTINFGEIWIEKQNFQENAFKNIGCKIVAICSCVNVCRHVLQMKYNSRVVIRYIMSIVCLGLSPLSQLSFMQYMELCVFTLPVSPVMIVRICAKLLHYHNRMPKWTTSYWWELGNKPMRCMLFYILLMTFIKFDKKLML